jgi:hypothetical protein
MPLRSCEAQSDTEPRFDPETVRQATVLAERLQEERQKERREKLSLPEIDALATEVGIDPACMREALDVVARARAAERERSSRGRLSLREKQGTAAGIGAVLLAMALIGSKSGGPPAMSGSPATVFASAPVPEGRPLIRNGSFEVIAREGTAPLKPGSRAIPGWKVTRGAVQHTSNAAASGQHSLLLEPRAALRVETFPTEPGHTYRIHFEMAGEPGAEAGVRRLQVTGLNVHWAHSCFTPAAGEGPLRWSPQSLDFQPEEVGTSMGWVNVSDAPIYLDNVRITKVVNGEEVPAVDP